MFTKEMQRALEADGEKLHQLTGEDHGPVFLGEEKPEFTVVDRLPGYANVTLQGTYTGAATAKDVEDRFCHSYFGGRDAWAKDGRWGCVVHTD